MASCQSASVKNSPELEELVQKQLSPLVSDSENYSFPSISILVVNGDNSQISHLGNQDFDDQKLFEVGGITTIFTAFLFAQLEKDQKVVRDDFIKDLFPTFGMPRKIEDSVQVKHLLAHSSGMPRVPMGFVAKGNDPFSKYDFKKMFLSIRKTPLKFVPDQNTSFSHLGYSLLGYGLAASMEMNYTDALKQKVLDPIGMPNTLLNIPQEQNGIVKAYTANNEEYKFWEASAFAPAIGLKTNFKDMESFVKVQLKPPKELKDVILKSRDILNDKGREKYAYGWKFRQQAGKKYYWLNGTTYGFTSVIVIEPEKKKAVFIVANKRNIIMSKNKRRADTRLTHKAFQIIKQM